MSHLRTTCVNTAIVLGLLWSGVTTARVFAQIALPPEKSLPADVQDRIGQVHALGTTTADSQAAFKYFGDPHPRVRLAAYGKVMDQEVGDAAVILGLAKAAGTDPDPAARAYAVMILNSWRYGRVASQQSRDRTLLLPEILKQTRAGAAIDRSSAFYALSIFRLGYGNAGQLQSAKDIAAACRAALTDADGTVRSRAITTAADLVWAQSSPQDSDPFRPFLLEALNSADPVVKEGAAKAVYGLGTMMLPDAKVAIDQLAQSNDAHNRSLAVAIRLRMDIRDIDGKLLEAAVRDRTAWVRAQATDVLARSDMPRGARGFQIVLYEAVLDTDPVVAQEAALRLSGHIPLNMGNLAWIGVRDYPYGNPLAPPRYSPAQQNAAKLCASLTAAERLQGIASLRASGASAEPAMQVLTACFADRDAAVAKAARAAAREVIRLNMSRRWDTDVIDGGPGGASTRPAAHRELGATSRPSSPPSRTP
jgi:hypothetical protein